jgi:hypothetical protein
MELNKQSKEVYKYVHTYFFYGLQIHNTEIIVKDVNKLIDEVIKQKTEIEYNPVVYLTMAIPSIRQTIQVRRIAKLLEEERQRIINGEDDDENRGYI